MSTQLNLTLLAKTCTTTGVGLALSACSAPYRHVLLTGHIGNDQHPCPALAAWGVHPDGRLTPSCCSATPHAYNGTSADPVESAIRRYLQFQGMPTALAHPPAEHLAEREAPLKHLGVCAAEVLLGGGVLEQCHRV